MTHRCNQTLLIILAGIVLLLPGTAMAAIGWPGAPRPLLQVETHDEVFDGVPVKLSDLVGAGLRIRVDSVGGWVHSGQSSSYASILLAHHSNPDVFLGLSVFPKQEVLPDLGKAHWDAYVGMIRTTCGESLIDLAEGGTMNGGDGMFVFGQPYREVVYTVQDTPGSPPRTRREVFCFIGGRLLAITLEGETASVHALSTAFQLFIVRLELIT